MKTVKHVLRPERVRLVPEQFSWIDQALVQRHFIDRCDTRSAALYLFLVTVADAQGLSYYGTSSIAARLHLRADEIGAARQHLIALDLIARKRRPRRIFAGRVADHAGEIADQEQHVVPKILELL